LMPEPKPRGGHEAMISLALFVGVAAPRGEGFDMKLFCQCNAMHRRDVDVQSRVALQFSDLIDVNSNTRESGTEMANHPRREEGTL
jgi:hypothetical protein